MLLEILALKKAQRPAVDEEPSKPEEETQSKDKPKAKPRKKSKKKAKDSSSAPDPDVLLDLLIDRLCIWRSIGSAATGAEPEGQENSNPEKLKDGGEDRLKHFCIEVVMALYVPPYQCFM